VLKTSARSRRPLFGLSRLFGWTRPT